MKRRTLIGLMGTGAASAFTVGSGAFNTSAVERSVTAEVVPDADAYLSISPQGSGGRSTDGYSPGAEPVRFRFPGPDDQDHPLDDEPSGLGKDSVYQFTRDKDPDNPTGLAEVKNQGTKTVEIRDEEEETSGLNIGLFDAEAEPQANGLRPLLRDEPVSLSPGESFKLGIQINTYDVETGEYSERVRFVATADEKP